MAAANDFGSNREIRPQFSHINRYAKIERWPSLASSHPQFRFFDDSVPLEHFNATSLNTKIPWCKRLLLMTQLLQIEGRMTSRFESLSRQEMSRHSPKFNREIHKDIVHYLHECFLCILFSNFITLESNRVLYVPTWRQELIKRRLKWVIQIKTMNGSI